MIRVLALILIALLLVLWLSGEAEAPEVTRVIASEQKFPTSWPSTTSTSQPSHVQVITSVPRARTHPTAPSERVVVVNDRDAIAQAIRSGFARFGAAVAEEAVKVAGCESTGDSSGSRLNPAARNGQHYGLFQISRTYHSERVARLGFTWEQMTQVGPNIAVAADLYAESGWGPWQCRWAA